LPPLFCVLIVGALVGPLGFGGWSFNAGTLAPKLERISPLKGLKRIFSSKGLMELVKAILKAALISSLAALIIYQVLDQLIVLSLSTLSGAVTEVGGIFVRCFIGFALVLVLIAAVDVPFQLYTHSQELMMTKQEVKDEHKESEGRPEVKSRIRDLQQAAARQRMMEAVPGADVVITNPTHFAVALSYVDGEMSAPRVVAKGRDLVAVRIRDLASEHKVPIFSAPPLARALYRNADIGMEIPGNLFAAVAQVLAYVFQLRARDPAVKRQAKPPADLPLPDEYLKQDQ